jgi:hypothetical protein
MKNQGKIERQGKYQAQHVLALLASYERSDWLAALERAVRFGAYSRAAVERILAATVLSPPLGDPPIDRARPARI